MRVRRKSLGHHPITKRTHGRCKRNAAKGLGWKWGGAERAKCEGRKGIPEKSKSRNVQSPIAGGFQGVRIQGFEEMRNGEWGMGSANPKSAICDRSGTRRYRTSAMQTVDSFARRPDCQYRSLRALLVPYRFSTAWSLLVTRYWLLATGYWLLRLRSMAAPRRSFRSFAVGRISAAAFQAGRGSPVRRPGRASESGLWAPRSYA